MAIFEKFLDSLDRIRNKVEEFKSDHTMANAAISTIIQSMPPPFDKFLGIVWDGLEKGEDSPKQILEVLEKFNMKNEILFIQQTQKISEILDKKPDKKDIIQLSEEIRNSKISIEKLLDEKLGKLTNIVKTNSKKLDKILENQAELKLTGTREIQESKAVISLNYVGEESNRYLEKKEFSNARALFQLILDKEPKNINAINNIALSYYLQDDFIEAEKWYKKGFETKPNDLHVLNDYYMTLLAQEKENEALILIDKLLEKDSENLVALYNKGVIQFHQDQYEEAIVTLDKVIQKQPNNLGALANKGSAYLGLEAFENALTCLNKALSIKEFPMALNNKAIALSKQGEDILEVKKLFKKSLNLEPENGSTLYNFGVTLYENKEFDDAIELFDKVPSTSLSFVEAMLAKGRIFLEKNQFENARVCFDKILEKDSQSAAGFAHRGLSYVMDGKIKEGLDDFKTALNIDPTNYVASENLKRIRNQNVTSNTKWSLKE